MTDGVMGISTITGDGTYSWLDEFTYVEMTGSPALLFILAYDSVFSLENSSVAVWSNTHSEPPDSTGLSGTDPDMVESCRFLYGGDSPLVGVVYLLTGTIRDLWIGHTDPARLSSGQWAILDLVDPFDLPDRIRVAGARDADEAFYTDPPSPVTHPLVDADFTNWNCVLRVLFSVGSTVTEEPALIYDDQLHAGDIWISHNADEDSEAPTVALAVNDAYTVEAIDASNGFWLGCTLIISSDVGVDSVGPIYIDIDPIGFDDPYSIAPNGELNAVADSERFQYPKRWPEIIERLITEPSAAFPMLDERDRQLEDAAAAKPECVIPFNYTHTWQEMWDPADLVSTAEQLDAHDREYEVSYLAAQYVLAGHECVFEYPHRWPQIIGLLASDPAQAADLLQQRDIELEEAFARCRCHDEGGGEV